MARDDFDRRLAALLEEIAPPATPAYLGSVQARARTLRQRAPWTFPMRWLPVDVRSGVPLVPAQRALLLLVIAALVFLAVGVAIGTLRRDPLPPPFGVARNGVLVADDGDDLIVVEPNGVERSLISGPAIDSRPAFSPDGERLAFLRDDATGRSLVVALADGTEQRVLASVPAGSGTLLIPEAPAWSPDSRAVAVGVLVTGGREHAEIWIVDTSTGTTRTFLPSSLFSVQWPVWSPAGGLAVLGEPTRRAEGFLYVASADESNLVRISDRAHNADSGYFLPARWSPDGTRITVHHGDPARQGRDVLVLSTDRVSELVVAGTPRDEAMPVWSPDGTRIAYVRTTIGFIWELVVVDPTSRRETAFPLTAGDLDSVAWSPDGTALVYATCPDASRCQLMEVDAEDPSVGPTHLADLPPKSFEDSNFRAYWSWQRRAP